MPTAIKLRNTTSLYSVHPGVKMVQDWVATLKEKTGRSLDEWLRLVKKSGPATEEARRDWLKKGHGFGTNPAWWIAERSVGKGEAEDDAESYLKTAVKYVEDMYSGSKAGLQPLHDALMKRARKLGKNVCICPCKTIVPLYRNHVFAEIKPATKTRIDLGFALGDLKAKGRLMDTGGYAKKYRITHRIPIASLDDIDAEVEKWLKEAYIRDG